MSIKDVDAPKSSDTSIFGVDLLHLIALGNNKQGVGFENKLGPFWLHENQGLVSWSLLRFDVFISQIFKMKGVDRSGLGCGLHFSLGQLLTMWLGYI